MANTPQLSVVFLVRNEERTIGPLIRETQEVLAALGVSFEIIVVDGGSTDNTWIEAQQAGAKIFLQKRFGYGGALREGLLAATGDYIVTLDADGSHLPKYLPELWKKRDAADIVIGSRFAAGGSTTAPLVRQVLSRILNVTFTKALHIPIRDISSGYRLYHRFQLTPEQYQSEDFNILEEILVRAYSDGCSVIEVPIHFMPRTSGTSKVSFVKFMWSYWHTLYELWVLRNSVESADYDHRAHYSLIPLQRYWQRMRHSIVTGYLEPKKQTLDIGCGSSKIIEDLPEAVAFDLAFRKLRYLRKTNPLRVLGSTFALPFKDAAFDQAIHSQVLEHVPFDKVIFRELRRILKPQGILVVGTPDYGRIWWPIIEFFYGKLLPNAYADEHITHYTKQSLIDILAEHGFRTLSYRYICGGELIVKAQKVE